MRQAPIYAVKSAWSYHCTHTKKNHLFLYWFCVSSFFTSLAVWVWKVGATTPRCHWKTNLQKQILSHRRLMASIPSISSQVNKFVSTFIASNGHAINKEVHITLLQNPQWCRHFDAAHFATELVQPHTNTFKLVACNVVWNQHTKSSYHAWNCCH